MLQAQRPCLAHSQNFLRDPRLVEHLLDRSTIGHRDLVYEIGPGTGVITGCLARRSGRVVAIEKDRQLAAALRHRFAACPHVAIHAADFLRFPLPFVPYKVFASIPYAHTAAIVGRLTAGRTAPLDSYLVMQREAAERFTGSPRSTLYAALLYPWFAALVLHHFLPTDFRPVPRVENTLLHLQRRPRPLIAARDTPAFRDFVAYGFTGPHATVRGALRSCVGGALAARIASVARLDPAAIPSMVPGSLWLLLFEHLKDAGGADALRRATGAEARLRDQQSRLQRQHRTRVVPASARDVQAGWAVSLSGGRV